MSFETLGLNQGLIKAIEEQGYETLTPIQKNALPELLKGRDFLALAPTGSGKTATYSLPILEAVSKEANSNSDIHSLIIAPTRELAIQIGDKCQKYGQYLNLEIGVVFGGITPKRHIKVLKRKPKILVATPGRLLDLISKGYVELSQVKILVLDEADKLLNSKSIEDMKKILALLPSKRQNIFLSATLSKSSIKMSKNFLVNPVEYLSHEEAFVPVQIHQILYKVEEGEKIKKIHDLIMEPSLKKVLIFTRTKKIADKLCKSINGLNIRCKAIHGDKNQSERIKALALFKNNEIRILVATDVAARGLDISQVSHVISMDVPKVPETYVHRIGRTGRAGFSGQGIVLCSQGESSYLKAIEAYQKQKIKVMS